MAKLTLMKKSEISVTEEKKGKQIAVKENNITSLKKFYQDNYRINENITQPIPSTEAIAQTPAATQETVSIDQTSATTNGQVIEPFSSIATPASVPETPTPTINEPIELNPVEVNTPTLDQPIQMESQEQVANESENAGGTNDAPVINLVPENNDIKEENEEMDPELKEIKERLDKVIMDLNNYKKKIKLLEEEVNQNLEKSREVLKDTQAAAKIMSIQQERQRQINEEVAGGTPLESDPTRILQKEA